VSYEPSVGAVTIECNIPVTITVRVRALTVSVQETSSILGYGRRTVTWGRVRCIHREAPDQPERGPIAPQSAAVNRTASQLAALGPEPPPDRRRPLR
jgi:hypothetical protein